MKARITVARLVVQHVPPARPERGAESDRPEGRPTNPKNHDIVILPSRLTRKVRHPIEQRRVAREVDTRRYLR